IFQSYRQQLPHDQNLNNSRDMRFEVVHVTEYIYEAPATLCHNLMFQIPKDLPFQEVEEYGYEISPKPSSEIQRTDFFGNKYLYFSVERSHKNLLVTSRS